MTYGHALTLATPRCACGRAALVVAEAGRPALCARCALAEARADQ